ncbi:MAG: DHHA1 domain-containing protein [archaeon]
MKEQKYLCLFKEFIEGIDKKDKLALIHHTDADGVCSAAIVVKALKKLGKPSPVLLHQENGEISLTNKTIKKLKQLKVNRLIAVDLSLDQRPSNVKKVERFASILVLDHHKIYSDLNSRKTVMIKSQMISSVDGSLYPASKLCFDLFSGLIELDEAGWIAAVGIIGDNGTKKWKEFILNAMKKEKIKGPINESILSRIKFLIDAVETISFGELEKVINLMVKAKKPKEMMKKKFLRYGERLEKELDEWISSFEERAEFFPSKELIYYYIKPIYPIKSPLINRISFANPGRTVVVVQDLGKGVIDISARRQDFRVKVNDLLEKATKNLEGSFAGGHIPAAGGKIKKKDLKKFRKNLLKLL